MGLDGQRFRMLKLRTMRVDAEARTGPVWATAGDPRRIAASAPCSGGFSLDELPQFVNVLRGEMSVVGPRPERPVFVERFRQTVPGYMLRHKVKSGVTGWAQVNGLRGNTSLEKRIEYDIEYIERWSLWLDLKIIALTVVRIALRAQRLLTWTPSGASSSRPSSSGSGSRSRCPSRRWPRSPRSGSGGSATPGPGGRRPGPSWRRCSPSPASTLLSALLSGELAPSLAASKGLLLMAALYVTADALRGCRQARSGSSRCSARSRRSPR